MISIPINCTGCTTCVTSCPKQCIKMKKSIEGFLYPSVEQDNCINCGICEKVCPVLSKVETHNKIKAFAMKNKKASERTKSASGGIFPLIAQLVVKKNGVIFGAAYNHEFEVRHIKVEKAKDIDRLQSAKYTQSMIEDIFVEVEKALLEDRWVVFSGTPCQCTGLKA